MGNVNTSPKSIGVESMNLSQSDSDTEADPEVSSVVLNYGGTSHYGNAKLFSLFAILVSNNAHL